MNNETLNNSLIEIEKNLKNIESARTQVNNITEKSEILTHEVTKLIDKIQGLHNEISKGKDGLSKDITNSIVGFQKSLEKESEVFIEKSKKVTASYQTNTVANIDKLEKFQDKIKVVEAGLANLDLDKVFSEIIIGQKNVLEHQKSIKLELKEVSTSFANSLNTLKVEQQYAQSDLLKIFKNQGKKISQLKIILFVIIVLLMVGFFANFLMLTQN